MPLYGYPALPTVAEALEGLWFTSGSSLVRWAETA